MYTIIREFTLTIEIYFQKTTKSDFTLKKREVRGGPRGGGG